MAKLEKHHAGNGERRMESGEWAVQLAAGTENREQRTASVLNRNKHNFHENQYINFRHI